MIKLIKTETGFYISKKLNHKENIYGYASVGILFNDFKNFKLLYLTLINFTGNEKWKHCTIKNNK